MKKKLFIIFICVFFIIAIVPSAFAVVGTTYYVTTGTAGTPITSTTLAGYTDVSVQTSELVEFEGNLGNIYIICSAGSNIEFTDVEISVDNNIITFTSGVNTLTIEGINILTAGMGSSCVFMNSGSLTIDGTGELTANGGADSRGLAGGVGIGGIGSSSLTIKSGNITAYGGNGSPGIGGYGATDFDILIEGGTITAEGGETAPGIGTVGGGDLIFKMTGGVIKRAESTSDAPGIGSCSGDSSIHMDYGTESVYAIGKGSGAGIGCAGAGYSGIYIDDGIIVAIGGEEGAGIGSGDNGHATIAISGGEIYAKGGTFGDDIGSGLLGSSELVDIINTAAVFTFNDTILTPTNPTDHIHVNSETITGNLAYGFSNFPDSWNSRTGYGYVWPINITYNHNHGVPADEDVVGTYSGAPFAELNPEPTRAGYVFNGWHFSDDGTNPVYIGEDTVIIDDTLYVDWVIKGTHSGKITGTLSYDDDSPADGIKVTLESTPINVTTSASGGYDFGSVFYINHSLIVRNTAGDIVKTYLLTFTEGSPNNAVIDEGAGTIDITYVGTTTGINIPLSLNPAEDDAYVSGEITFSEGNIDNPRTGDAAVNIYLYLLIALSVVMASIVIFLKAKNTQKI